MEPWWCEQGVVPRIKHVPTLIATHCIHLLHDMTMTVFHPVHLHYLHQVHRLKGFPFYYANVHRGNIWNQEMSPCTTLRPYPPLRKWESKGSRCKQLSRSFKLNFYIVVTLNAVQFLKYINYELKEGKLCIMRPYIEVCIAPLAFRGMQRTLH